MTPAPLTRRDGLLVQEFAGEAVVYDLTTHAAHNLNRPAAELLRRCDGTATPADLAAALSDALGERVDEDAVRLSLRRLRRAGLLSGPDATAAPSADPAAARGRREALRAAVRVGVVATISSFAVPTDVLAESG